MSTKEKEVLRRIREVAHKSVPAGSRVLLYGSRARGDAHEGSDWDVLILLDKPSLTLSDYGIGYPLKELGWELDEDINPQVYSKQEWRDYHFTPFYKNVEQDKKVLI